MAFNPDFSFDAFDDGASPAVVVEKKKKPQTPWDFSGCDFDISLPVIGVYLYRLDVLQASYIPLLFASFGPLC